jgi:hypothetical protein
MMQTDSMNGAQFTHVIELTRIDPHLITALQAGAIANCSPQTVNKAAAAGRLQAYSQRQPGYARKGTRRMHYYKQRDIQMWVAEGRPTAKRPDPVLPLTVAPDPPVPVPTTERENLHGTLKQLTATMSRLAEDMAAIKRDLGVK